MLLTALAFLYITYTSQDSDQSESKSTKLANHQLSNGTNKNTKNDHDHSDQHSHSKIKYTVKQKKVLSKARSMVYEEEVERVNKMTNNYPESREELISFISQNDPYKEANISIKPHTVDSVKQNQIGALKVLALKTIHLKEQSNQARIKFYEDLLSRAKDPTIIKILKASIASARQGRNFLKDFPDAIHNGPSEKTN